MRRFDKSYLDKWNERLKKLNLSLSLNDIQYTQVITICGIDNSYSGYLGVQGYRPTPEPIYKVPEISYIFNFSVSKKCSKRFYELLQTLLKSGTTFYYTTKDYSSSYSKGQTDTKSIICQKNLSEFTIEKTDIKIHQVDYIQNTCKLSTNLFDIIHFVNSVESAVEIISNYFEYDEDGKEICKTKFQVNEIVSTKEDRSGNYMILDFSIQQDNTISYKVSKILNNITSEVILFDGISILKEDDILPNREDRLNILLN
jgi:hypothetical protein